MNQLVIPYYDYEMFEFKSFIQMNLRRNYYNVEQAAKISKQKESQKYKV